ncbi:pyridoxal phosphate-dependent aminotransferase [Rhizobium sp. L1K21]|uniref:pyridoxal phosphate-dependent aminotransferase n=1 Tax=Rhizobium sp. L1K21 TaxID=2954933 RepID=UPI0020934505|nr:pyridoxal phosphate-dependent aminotransferase [Rhizobium sp. L1K21]MCO6188633.1 pyridoxal phosphate-dependent aminotransferase [Rhizobium sp. L1K21]
MEHAVTFKRASRIAALEISEIVQLAERAAVLRSEGRDVLSFATGEPDFPTPEHVVEAAHEAALAGKTRYPATVGTPELRKAIAAVNNVNASEVIVSTGAKQVLANAMLATLEPGDAVIMPAPYWTSYSDIVKMAEGEPVVIPCSMADNFKLSPERLEAAITPRTRWLMLNSPSNPTGVIYSADEIKALAAVLQRHPHVWVLADEIYEHLNFVDFTSFKTAAPELADRTLIVNGVSKAYSMTGWRIGWGIGPVALIKAMGAVQGQVTSGACSIAQAAALAALTGDQTLLDTRRKALLARRNKVVDALNSMAGIECPSPDGAFYAFPNIEGAMKAGGFASDAEFCAWLLDHANVAIVPGRAFGLPGHARLSFAYSDTELDAGLQRIAAAVASRTNR